MKKEEILIIKKTWRLVKDIDPLIFGDVFYSKLFLEYPSLKKIFNCNREDQYKKLVDLLTYFVLNINDLEKNSGILIEITNTYNGFGVKPEHYKKMGEALIWTLKKGLGNDWNKEIEKAWQCCSILIIDKMMKAENH